jgi:hypothetical protein
MYLFFKRKNQLPIVPFFITKIINWYKPNCRQTFFRLTKLSVGVKKNIAQTHDKNLINMHLFILI